MSHLGMYVTLRNVNLLITLRNDCARAEVTWPFIACAKARDFSVAAANYYTGARTVVRSWRARRRAIACAFLVSVVLVMGQLWRKVWGGATSS